MSYANKAYDMELITGYHWISYGIMRYHRDIVGYHGDTPGDGRGHIGETGVSSDLCGCYRSVAGCHRITGSSSVTAVMRYQGDVGYIMGKHPGIVGTHRGRRGHNQDTSGTPWNTRGRQGYTQDTSG